ncbi:MAG: hypothetical protein A2V67_07510 [Deltaproteobacteria bacterium RBG_13_61_14]|nr:MAG: hypothetical protein A2V67_07510 [Deltaproteobacteria bacterium RBG_13_61_14]
MEQKRNRPKTQAPQGQSPSSLDLNLLQETSGDCNYSECERLLGQGADVNARDEEGCTPLLWAVFAGEKDVVELLLARGADIRRANNDGETPLHWAVLLRDHEIAALLLAKGADVNTKDTFGLSPLRSATLNEDQEMVALLRRYGAQGE